MSDKNMRMQQPASQHSRAFMLIAIMIIGFNLRPAITSVGPLLGMIRDQIGLANWSAGTITSLPLIAFAFMSPLAPRLGKRLGHVRAVLLGLVLLTAGIGVRSLPFTVSLFIGTAIIGVGIAIMNVLLPAIIKDKFPHKVGQMTSVYSTSMAVFAATASGISVPLAQQAGLGWELALISWGLLAVVGIGVWMFIAKKEPPVEKIQPEKDADVSVGGHLWQSPLAWQVTFFMGTQSFIFYVTVSWLPEMMQTFGFSVAAAGWLVSYAQFVSLPATFLAPMLAERFANQQGIVLGIGTLLTIGFTGILIGGPLPLIVVWVTLIGLASGASISLSLALLGMRARDAEQASDLSGMAQSVGYVFAAIGPLFVGLLFDLTGAWTWPLIAIIVVSLLMTVAGLGAGRDKFVTEDEVGS